MVFPILGTNTESAAYEISNSLRFEKSSNEYLYWLPTSNPTGGGQTFTFSFWYKPTASYPTNQYLFGNADDDSDTRYGAIRHRTGASGALEFSFGDNNDGGWKFDLETSALLRDPAAWYHIICQSDTTNSTEGDRIKIYINGERVTSFGTDTYPAQNYVSDFGANDIEQTVGGVRDTDGNYSSPFSGYLSDVYFIDGQALDSSYFGETNDNGVWIPKKYAGSYGTNGYKLEFQQTGTSANSSGMGADTSGNDHHFTVVALDATSVTTDTPTNNFCTINPIDVGSGHTSLTISEGNTKVVKSSTESNPGDGDRVGTTMKFTKGKWYWEEKAVSGAATGGNGIYSDKLGGQAHWHDNYGYYFDPNGNESNSGSQIARRQENDEIGYGSSAMDDVSNNDIIMCALDLDNNRWYIGVNGQWSNNNAAGGGTATANSAFNQSSLAGYFTIPSGGNGGFWGVFFGPAGSTTAKETQFNFGNPPFSISSSNADANGYGNFEYAVPSGYYSMCTKNLAEYG